MLKTITICCFLLCVPVILWSIPKTRRMTGSWITAWKTVPVGCLMAYMIPTLLFMAVGFLSSHYGWFSFRRWSHFTALLLGIIGLAAGAAVIVFLARWIWKKYQAEGKRSWLPFSGLFILLAVFSIILYFACLFIQAAYTKDYKGNWHTYVIPTDGKTELAFEQRPIHPMMAEYDYRLRFRRDGTTIYRDLRTNTGGRTHFNIYRLKDERLLFSDKDSDYIVDPEKNEVLFLLGGNGGKTSFVQCPEKICSFGYSTNSEDDKVTYSINGKEVVTTPLTYELADKVYYGCLTNDFYPASEKREESVY